MAMQVGTSEPYAAFNGHVMVAPEYQSDRAPDLRYKVYALAQCVADCPACARGATLAEFAGEEE
jgi:hypothetical protein